MFDITLDEALKIYAEPKRRGGQGAAAPPLRELGTDPASDKPMVIKDGRFGPYVTDGETNASLRKGDDVLSITDERASELLADRRARGPVKKVAKKAAPRRRRQEGARQEGRGQEELPSGERLQTLAGTSRIPVRRQPDSSAGPAGSAH